MKDTVYVALIKVNVKNEDEYFLMLTRGSNKEAWTIHGFETLRDGVNYFEEGYHRAHGRSYESSMSACINWMFYHPSILPLQGGTKKLQKLIGKDAICKSYHHVSGSFEGVVIEHKRAKFLWELGVQPSLWNPDKMNKIWDEQETVARMSRYET